MPPDSAERAAFVLGKLPIRPSSRIMDVGCGTGVSFAPLAAKVGPGGFIVALDVSFPMLHVAKHKVNAFPVARIQADALDVPLADNAFDWVVCYNMFPHFTDQQQAVSKMTRALKKGGHLVIAHGSSREDINEHHRQVGDVVGGHELPDDETLCALFGNAGLNIEILDAVQTHFLAVACKT